MEKEYLVKGIHCSNCATSIEDVLKEAFRLEVIRVHSVSHRLFIKGKELPDKQGINKILRPHGYEVVELGSGETSSEVKGLWLRVALGGILMYLGMFRMGELWAEVVMGLLATTIMWMSRQVYVRAYQGLKQKKATMDTLVALSTSVAYVYSLVLLIYRLLIPTHAHMHQAWHSHFEAAGLILVFISIGKYLEYQAQRRTVFALEDLLELNIKRCKRVLLDGSIQEVGIEQVGVGERILVGTGEQFPVDGVIEEGSTSVDERMFSGEPLPVEKSIGAKVYCGSMNVGASVVVRAERMGKETMVAQMVQTVQATQMQKMPIEQVTDKIAGRFAWIVMGLALVASLLWFILSGEHGLQNALYVLITVLVVACPCALGLATPLAIVVALGKAFKKGILIQKIDALERLLKVDSVFFDKTGTLTEGKPRVKTILWEKDMEEHANIAILRQFVQYSHHPISKAIQEHLRFHPAKHVRLNITDVEAVPGMGFLAKIDSMEVLLGNENLLNIHQVSPSEQLRKQIEDYTADTLSYFCMSGKVVCVIVVADSVKEEAAKVVQSLKGRGMEIKILSGDKPVVVAAVANRLGIAEGIGKMLPPEKALFIQRYQRRNKRKVLMVGDGINDVLAMATAEVSISMGAGSDISLHSSDIILVNNHLQGVLEVIRLAEQTRTLIYQNLFWAFIYNVVMLPIAAGALYPINGFMLSPMAASIAMSLSSISVVLNSLRVRWQR